MLKLVIFHYYIIIEKVGTRIVSIVKGERQTNQGLLIAHIWPVEGAIVYQTIILYLYIFNQTNHEEEVEADYCNPSGKIGNKNNLFTTFHY